MPFTQKLTQKYMQGMMFYNMLSSQNDSHYVGGGVKLGTPDRPIFWYKPTGADKYRVIYADLSVKEAAPAEIKDFPKAPEGYTAANDEHRRVRSGREGLDRNAARLCRRAEWPAAADP